MASDSSKKSTLLYKKGKFSYHVLTPKYRDAALVVLSRAFCTEPVVSALAKIKPEMETTFLDWVEFVDYWMDHCSSNGMSVVALDEENHRVAGVFIVRDLLMVPPGFDTKYSSDAKTLTPWMQFLWHMDREATKKMPELGHPGKAVDLWFLGVHPDYRGNGIANYLVKGVVPLCAKAGFKYATIEATSAYTSMAARFNKFTSVHVEEAAQWKWKGKPLYTNAEKPHGTWTFWVKDLQTVDIATPPPLPPSAGTVDIATPPPLPPGTVDIATPPPLPPGTVDIASGPALPPGAFDIASGPALPPDIASGPALPPPQE